jgi:MFS family permease
LETLRTIRETLAERNFGIYIAGNGISLIGMWMQRIGAGWLAWELSGSASVLGLLAFCDLFPAVLIGPFGGALADRLDRRRMMLVAVLLNTLQALTLFVLTALGLITIPLLLALVLFTGIVIGFNQPARLALIPSLVSRERLATAVTINAIIFNGARLIGPALAGVVIFHGSVAPVFALNALSFIAFLLALVRLDLPPFTPAKAPPPVLEAIRDGLRYATGHPGIGPILGLHLALALGARPLVELFPGFADAVFGQGAAGLAILSSIVGVGAVLGGFWLAGQTTRLTETVLAAAGLLVISTFAFALAPSFAVAVLVAGIAGACMLVAGAGTQTVIQTAVEEIMRGRVLSLYGLILRGGPALGALALGVAADVIGLRTTLALGALLAFVAWFGIWRRRRQIAEQLRA